MTETRLCVGSGRSARPGANVADVLSSFSARTEPQDGLGNNPFKLGCTLGSPATKEEIRDAWASRTLPAELLEAWSVSRESRLFEDVEYGQWGLILLTPAASARRTSQQCSQRPGDYRPDDVVIGEFLGDLELLVIGPSEVAGRQILVALPLDHRDAWYSVASSLAQFLDRYREAHGAKFWERAP